MNSIQQITSRDNALLMKIRKLATTPTAYRQLNQLWLEGEHLCEVAAQSNSRLSHCIVTQEAWDSQLAWREWAKCAQQTVIISSALFKGISGLESAAQIGFLMDGDATPKSLDAIEANAPTLVLDRIQDAGNVGTILRSGAALGFRQVLALKGTAALGSPKVLRAAMGAHFSLHWMEALEIEALDRLNIPLLATSSHATHSLLDTRLPFPCAWVFGHEGQGISTSIEQRCPTLIRIPQPGGQESLNVAAAASICLYESMRQQIQG